MLELLDFDVDDAVAWRIEGKVTEDDMEQALDALRKIIDRCGHVSVYQEIVSIGGVEWDAIEEKMEFLREIEIRMLKSLQNCLGIVPGGS